MLTVESAIEEIALEGSDGITIECFYARLAGPDAQKSLTPAEQQKLMRFIARDQVRYKIGEYFLTKTVQFWTKIKEISAILGKSVIKNSDFCLHRS